MEYKILRKLSVAFLCFIFLFSHSNNAYSVQVCGVTVIGNATNYCPDTISAPYTVTNLVLTPVSWPDYACVNEQITLTVDTIGTGTLSGGTLEALWEQKQLSASTFSTIANSGLTINATPAAPTQYRVTLTTKNSIGNVLSTQTFSKTIDVRNLGMGGTAQYSICKNSNVSMEGDTQKGTAWEWLDEDRNVLVPLTSNPVLKELNSEAPSANTTYYFVAHWGTCSAEQEHQVSVKDFIQFTVDKPSVVACKNDVVTITATSTLPTTGVTYAWVRNPEAAITANPYTLNTTTATNGVIRVTPSALGYCAEPIDIDYNISELVIAQENWTDSFCEDEEILLTVNTAGSTPANITFNWFENNAAQAINSNQASFNPQLTTTYKVVVNTDVCADSLEKTIIKINTNLELGEDIWICPADKVTLLADTTGTGKTSGLYNISWQKRPESELVAIPMSTFGTTVYDNPSEQTTYFVTVNHAHCSSEQQITVYMHPVPVISDVIEIEPKTAQIIVSNGTGPFQFAVDDKNEYVSYDIFSGLRIGKHTAYVIDENNCKANRSFVINEAPIVIPIYFSPNEDGMNDTWEIENLNIYEEVDLQIFDRFGKSLIKITDPTQSWDGTYMGKPMKSDDYWYVLYVRETGKKYVGHFTLIR